MYGAAKPWNTQQSRFIYSNISKNSFEQNFFIANLYSFHISIATKKKSIINKMRINPTKQKLEMRIPLNRRSNNVKTRKKPINVNIENVIIIPKNNNNT